MKTKIATQKPAKAPGPVIWAIDPLQRDPKQSRNLVKAIELWQSYNPSSVMPAAVLSPVDLGWPADILYPIQKDLTESMTRSVQDTVVSLAHRERPRILMQKNPMPGSTVQELVDCAKKEKASLIAVSTTGRHGFRRLGSFSERLISSSPIPVLAVNPHARVPKKIGRILFPTDFSASSADVFEDLLKFAAKADAEIVIYYQRQPVWTPSTAESAAFDAAVIQAWADLERERRDKGQLWVQAARAKGVRAEFVFSAKPGPLGRRIVAAAKRKKADLIVTVAHGGPITQLVLGGTARDILEFAGQPVLVYHRS